VSRLRARCPACRANSAVAIGPDYECHACGRSFAAGLVRVPRAWGAGGDAMAAAARLELPYPEAAVVEEETLAMQSLAVASELPVRPLVLGGCCCAHVGAVEGLAARHERLGLVWIDAHGDLNTPESSPSGNEWGMPLRMLLDAATVAPGDVALVGARELDEPERDYLAGSPVRLGVEGLAAALAGVDAVYAAFDADVLAPGELEAFMPEPGGLSLGEAAALLREVASRATLAGLGFAGLVPSERAVPALLCLCAAAGF